MKTKTAFWVVLFAMTMAGSAYAWVLCPKCAGRGYTEDIGTCSKCGGHTASGQFSLCADCAKKLNRCCHCGGPLAADKPAGKPDAGKPDKANKPNRADAEPAPNHKHTDIRTCPICNPQLRSDGGNVRDDATQAKLAAARAKTLKSNLGSFSLRLTYHGEQDKPFYTLHLHGKGVPVNKARLFFASKVAIDNDLAEKIVDHLNESGFLGRARDADEPIDTDAIVSAYMLTVAGPDNLALTHNLGWGPDLLEKLDALRAALGDGEAGRKMDLLLGRIGFLREKK
jgi:hypothetical protein